MIIPALYCGGGLQKISLQLSQELIIRNHNVIVVDEYQAPMDKLKYLRKFPKFEKIDSYDISNNNLTAFSKIIKDNAIDLIFYHGFFPRVNKFLKIWKKDNNTKIVSIYHNTPDSAMPKGIKSLQLDTKGLIKTVTYPLYYLYSHWKVARFLKAPYLFSERITLLSNQFISIYKQYTKVDNKIVSIPNFVNIPYLKDDNRKKQLLYVGRLEESQKKVSRIIRIWEKIYPLCPDWQLLLAGEGRCRHQYEKYITDKGIKGVTFLGYVSDPTRLFAQASISLMTSDFEGFSMTNIEAMSTGCVPIAYNSFKSITDIIDDNINGILVKPFSEKEYIKKLLYVMNNDNYRESLSTNAKYKAQTFSTENIIPQWEDLINSVLNE